MPNAVSGPPGPHRHVARRAVDDPGREQPFAPLLSRLKGKGAAANFAWQKAPPAFAIMAGNQRHLPTLAIPVEPYSASPQDPNVPTVQSPAIQQNAGTGL